VEQFNDNLLAHVESPWRPEWATDWDGWEDEPVPVEQFAQEHEREERWVPAISPADRDGLMAQAIEIIDCAWMSKYLPVPPAP